MDLSFMQNEFVLALCWTLIHSIWQGLLLAIVTGAVLMATRRAHADRRYTLLAILFFVFIGVTAVTFIRELNLIQKNSTASAAPAGHQLAPVSDAVLFSADSAAVPLSFPERLKEYFNTHAALIVAIWFMVFVARFVKLTAGLMYVQRLKHYKTNSVPDEWIQKLEELVASLRISKPVRLLESGIVKVPLVMGVLKPVILLPAGLLAHLPADEVEAILLHELAHIKRRDYFVNILQSFAEALFFFNPALMWLSSMVREERENCCDDIAISVTNNKSKFINALIAFQEYDLAKANYTVGFMGKKNQLLNRVKRIVSEKNKTLNAAEKSLLTLGMGIFILFTFAAAKKIEKKIENNKTESTLGIYAGTPTVRSAQAGGRGRSATLEDIISIEHPSYTMQFSDVQLPDTTPGQIGKPFELYNKSKERPDTAPILSPGRPFELYKGSDNPAVEGREYARYGEVVKYADLVNKDTPQLKKTLSMTSPDKTVTGAGGYPSGYYQMEVMGKLKAHESVDTVIRDGYYNISVSTRKDDSKDVKEVSATKKNGTQIKYTKSQGTLTSLSINGNQIPEKDFTQYNDLINEVETEASARLGASIKRRTADMERKQEMLRDEKNRLEDRKRLALDQRAHSMDEKRLEINRKRGAFLDDSLIQKMKRNAMRDSQWVKRGDEKRLAINLKPPVDNIKSITPKVKLDSIKRIDLKVRPAKVKSDSVRFNVKRDWVAVSKPGKYPDTIYWRKDTRKEVREKVQHDIDSIVGKSRRQIEKKDLIRKQISVRDRSRVDMDRMEESAAQMRNIVSDLEKEGVKVDMQKSWFALDKDQFIVDGKKMSAEQHEKFVAKYIKSRDGMGYYYGPIQVRGRGIFLDYKYVVK